MGAGNSARALACAVQLTQCQLKHGKPRGWR